MTNWITRMIEVPTVDATSSARDDVATIGHRVGYDYINIYRYNGDYESDQAVDSRIDGITAAVSGDDYLIHQYPTNNGPRFETRFIDRLNWRGTKIIIWVHDVESLRNQCPDGFDEYAYFNKAAALIVPNPATEQVLKAHGVTVPMVAHYIFDYLDDTPLPAPAATRQLVFAGNLDKSAFLGDWTQSVPVTVFGIANGGLADKLAANPQIDYRGALYRNELNAALGQGLGLVWDLDSAYGNFFTYTKYINPYKLTLYLSHGLPVIVSDEAAVAPFVTANHLGFAVHAIADIDGLLAAQSDDDLKKLTARVVRFAALLRTGSFTQRALLAAHQVVAFGTVQYD
ncbi:hypothetical protein [Schleiferilactobacillus shenzhenensis]|nr:hypothetical protein [Schleiferilactobacillus shenzhenensis]